jgi:hypothetical protein
MIQGRVEPETHHRRSIRLKGYDYTQPGAYFVTVCTQDRACLFGAVADGEMQVNNPGQIAKAAWDDMPARFPSVRLDAFIVMPNHVHGIIMVGAQFIAPPDGFDGTNQGVMNHAPTLGRIVRAYKAASTRKLGRRAPRILRGNAIITNTSSATKNPWIGSGSTFSITRRVGNSIARIRRRRPPNRRTHGPAKSRR